jgi:hypothetical protein
MSSPIESSRERTLLASRLPLIGLLLIQIFVGYEWFMSGLTLHPPGLPG